ALNQRLRKNQSNLLNRSIRVLAFPDIELESSLIVDEDHPFYFDHPLDHVSGLQLIDAMNQLCLSGIFLANPDIDASTLNMTKARISFDKFCKKTETAFVNCRQLPNLNQRQKYQCTVAQSGTRLTQAEFEFISSIPWVIPGGNALGTEELIPCAKDIVNKVNADNVFITAAKQQDDWIYCQLLPLRETVIFSDRQNQKHLDAVHLIEASRQSLRAIEYLIRKKVGNTGQERSNNNSTMGILKAVELFLERPVCSEEPVLFKTQTNFVSSYKVGSNMLIVSRIVIAASGQPIGHFEIKILLMDQTVYKRMRDDGVASLLQAKSN
ncbi:MAG: AfsA-related hotdog domain-containing protein, partial [Pseudomonadota bacterium]